MAGGFLEQVDITSPVWSRGTWKGLETRGWKDMLRSKNEKRHLTEPGWERSGHPGHLSVPLPQTAQTESRSMVIALGYTVIS